MRKKIILIATILITIPLLGVLSTNWIVMSYAKGQTYSSLENIEHNRVGLLLGTSRYQVGGGINPYFENRITAAVKLFKNGKIDFILVSGDNSHIYYNEPRDMKEALLERGIPLDCIVLDYAGFRTLDSVLRAKLVFGLDSVTIISQHFHLTRAIYLAETHGMHAVGFNAKDPEENWEIHFREYFAKTKACFDVLFNVQPKFLGPRIIIGDSCIYNN